MKAGENGGGLDLQMDSRSGDSSASVVVVLAQQEDEKQQLLRRQQRKKRGGEEDVEEGRHGNRDEEGEREKGEGDGQLSQPSQQWGWQWDASLYCYECNVSPSGMQNVCATVKSRLLSSGKLDAKKLVPLPSLLPPPPPPGPFFLILNCRMFKRRPNQKQDLSPLRKACSLPRLGAQFLFILQSTLPLQRHRTVAL